MILVFCEFGGQKLLGKARELADMSGSRVLALTRENGLDTQSLISLGADEVLTCSADRTQEWVDVISDLVRKSRGLRITMFASNRICDSIMSGVYAECADNIGTYFDGIDRIEGDSLSKSFPEFGVRANDQLSEEKVALVSVKLSSVPEPFEEGSRYGKVTKIPFTTAPKDDVRLSTISDCRGVSSILTILLGSNDPKLLDLCDKVAQKYFAIVKEVSGRVQVVYGPCLAVEVKSKLGQLPNFKGPLISINSARAPVTLVSDLAGISEDIEGVLEGLL